ncbi:MAG: nucleotide exchange factor GrpE [Methanobacterium sp.]|nr:nucleotide exchange factor GrpE [Methanobacterium sp.]
MTDTKELKQLKEELKDLQSEIREKNSQKEEYDQELGKKEKIIKEQEEKLDDYYSQLQRLQADFENYKKRSEKDLSEYIRYANENLILKILETYEDLGRALNSGKSQDLQEGVELIYKNLKNILEAEGLQEICVEGEKFDPFKHEALMVEDNNEFENGTIIEELGKGYTLDSKVIKYSKVKVCKKR